MERVSAMSNFLTVDELFDRIAQLLPMAIAFNGIVVRSASMRYANEFDFLSGEGAADFGGRWNQRGIPAIYASLDIDTAIQEAYYRFIEYQFPLTAIRPRVIAAAEAKLSAVLDLNDSSVRRRIGFSLQYLLEEPWEEIQNSGEESWTQAIGRGCRAARLEGLIVPSARKKGGKNLVIFPDRLGLKSSLKPIAVANLPPHPSHWK